MNKFYYGPRDRLTPKFYKGVQKFVMEVLKFIKLTMWSVIVLFILLLLGYELTIMNFLSSAAICLILKPITKFILKTKRIEV